MQKNIMDSELIAKDSLEITKQSLLITYATDMVDDLSILHGCPLLSYPMVQKYVYMFTTCEYVSYFNSVALATFTCKEKTKKIRRQKRVYS